MVLFFIFCLSSYIGLVLLWLLLGAIINPNFFLVYATATLTFLTFVSTKYLQFKYLTAQGIKSIRLIVEESLRDKVKEIAGVFSQEILKTFMGLRNIEGVNIMNDLAANEAKQIGLEFEYNELKNFSDDPEKAFEGAFHNSESAIFDPDKLKKKMKGKKDVLFKKAEEAFIKKCELYDIPEEVMGLLANIIFQRNQKKTNQSLSQFLEKNLTMKFRIDFPKHKNFCSSLIALIAAAETPSNRQEVYHVLVSTLTTDLVNHYLSKYLSMDTQDSDTFSDNIGDLLSLMLSQEANKEKLIFEMLRISINLVKIKTLIPPFIDNVLTHCLQPFVLGSKEEIKSGVLNLISELKINKKVIKIIEFFMLFDKNILEEDNLVLEIDRKKLTGFFKDIFSAGNSLNNEKSANLLALACLIANDILKKNESIDENLKELLKILKLDNHNSQKSSISLDVAFPLAIKLFVSLTSENEKAKGMELINSLSLEDNCFGDLLCLCTKELWKIHFRDQLSELRNSALINYMASKIGVDSFVLINILSVLWDEEELKPEEVIIEIRSVEGRENPFSFILDADFSKLRFSGTNNENKVNLNMFKLFKRTFRFDMIQLLTPKTSEKNTHITDKQKNEQNFKKMNLLLKHCEDFCSYKFHVEFFTAFILIANKINVPENISMFLKNNPLVSDPSLSKRQILHIIKLDTEFISTKGRSKIIEEMKKAFQNEKSIVENLDSIQGIQVHVPKDNKKIHNYVRWKEIRDSFANLNKTLKNNNTVEDRQVYLALIMNWNKDTEYLLEDENFLRDMKSHGISPEAFEAMLLLKYFFTNEPKAFLLKFVSSNKDFVEAILSIFNMNPDYRLISQYLKIPKYKIESLLSLLKILIVEKGLAHEALNIDEIESKESTLLWCNKLGIVKRELFSLLRVRFNLIRETEIDKIISDLNLHPVKIDRFKSIITLFSYKILPEVLEKKGGERDLMNSIKKINFLKSINIKNPEQFLYDLDYEAGNFHNLRALFRYSRESTDQTHSIRSEHLSNIYFHVLGSLICEDFSDINPTSILYQFDLTDKLVLYKNSFKSVLFWFFKKFNIHPLILLFHLNNEPSKNYVKNILTSTELKTLSSAFETVGKGLENASNEEISPNQIKMDFKMLSRIFIKPFEDQLEEYSSIKKALWQQNITIIRNLSIISLIKSARDENFKDKQINEKADIAVPKRKKTLRHAEKLMILINEPQNENSQIQVQVQTLHEEKDPLTKRKFEKNNLNSLSILGDVTQVFPNDKIKQSKSIIEANPKPIKKMADRLLETLIKFNGSRKGWFENNTFEEFKSLIRPKNNNNGNNQNLELNKDSKISCLVEMYLTNFGNSSEKELLEYFLIFPKKEPEGEKEGRVGFDDKSREIQIENSFLMVFKQNLLSKMHNLDLFFSIFTWSKVNHEKMLQEINIEKEFLSLMQTTLEFCNKKVRNFNLTKEKKEPIKIALNLLLKNTPLLPFHKNVIENSVKMYLKDADVWKQHLSGLMKNPVESCLLDELFQFFTNYQERVFYSEADLHLNNLFKLLQRDINIDSYCHDFMHPAKSIENSDDIFLILIMKALLANDGLSFARLLAFSNNGTLETKTKLEAITNCKKEDLNYRKSFYTWARLPYLAKLYNTNYLVTPIYRKVISRNLMFPFMKLVEDLVPCEREDLIKENKGLMEIGEEYDDNLLDIVEYYCMQNSSTEINLFGFVKNFIKAIANDLELSDLRPKLMEVVPLELLSFVKILVNLLEGNFEWDSNFSSEVESILKNVEGSSNNIKNTLKIIEMVFLMGKFKSNYKTGEFKNNFIKLIDIMLEMNKGNEMLNEFDFANQSPKRKISTKIDLNFRVINEVFEKLKILIGNPIFPYNNPREYYSYIESIISLMKNTTKEEINLLAEGQEKSSEEENKFDPHLEIAEKLSFQSAEDDNLDFYQPKFIVNKIIDLYNESFKVIELMKDQEKSSNKEEMSLVINNYVRIAVYNLVDAVAPNSEGFTNYINIRKKIKLILRNITYLIKAEFEHLTPDILPFFGINAYKFEKIKKFLIGFREVVKGPQQFIEFKLDSISEKILRTNLGAVKSIMTKIEENIELTFHDLFKLVDKDNSGSISLQEFKILSRRLGIDLSDHRIREIFTSVKLSSDAETTNTLSLNIKEFELSINYLQDKSVVLALERLGLSMEYLTGLLFFLTFILLIIFGFIFIGVEAFAIAGTFGSIINSIFPIAGGTVLSNKNNRHSEILESDEFKSTVDKCVKIVQSMKI